MLYRMSHELRSIFQSLIPEKILSQKCHTHMGTIGNGSELVAVGSVADVRKCGSSAHVIITLTVVNQNQTANRAVISCCG
jgi:hypothetical protein